MNESSAKVLITGATGMIGSLILATCLEREDIGQVVVLTRKPTGESDPKLQEIIVEDFLRYDGLEDALTGVDAAFLCLGVYTGAVPPDIFRKITVDYTRALGEALKQHSPAATVCYLSGAGADPAGKSRMMFARDKGAAENALLELGFPQACMFRPAYIYPVVSRNEPNVGYRIMRFLYPVMKAIYPSGSITSVELAQAMLHVGLHGAPKAVLENQEIKEVPSTGF